jgi:sugar transferase EpsL
VKTVFDRTTAFVMLTISSPLILIASIAIYVSMGRPVLFVQERPGFLGKPFRIYKLRTMSEGPADGSSSTDDVRITRVGNILRRLSIDELPQLWNVLKGDLSLVGPRPLLMSYLDRYSDEQMRRHDVMPGITGWAQVNGRNAIEWSRRFDLDLWYVDNWSLRLDAKILWLTAGRVLRSSGINYPGRATMVEFRPDDSTKGPT